MSHSYTLFTSVLTDLAGTGFLPTVERIAEQVSPLKFAEANSLRARLRELEGAGETARRVLAKDSLKETLDNHRGVERLLERVEALPRYSSVEELIQWGTPSMPNRQCIGESAAPWPWPWLPQDQPGPDE